MSVPPSEGPAQPGRRRIVMLPQKVLAPVALVAREGEERDALEQQVTRSRPVVTFPSLAHFCTESTLKERWAGILVARTHAWDSRLDDYVPRRAFIALHGLTDEGYGWPDAVKRIATTDELEAWLTLLSAPTLPEDDKPRPAPRASRPRKERVTRIVVPLAPPRAQVEPGTSQLALPMTAGEQPGTTPPAPAADTETAEPRKSPKRPEPAAVERPPRRAAAAEPTPATTAPKARGVRGEQLAFAETEGQRRTELRPEPASARGRGGKQRAEGTHRTDSVGAEAAITRVALELGFARAEELLRMVRERAHEIAKNR